MISKFRLLVLLSFIDVPIIYSQISIPGTPESFKIQTKADVVIPSKLLEGIDTTKMLADDYENGISNRYGVLQQIDVNIKSSGCKTLIPGKGYIWRYIIKSPFTYSLGIQFTKYQVPPGASVFIYNDSHTQLMGAFTYLNNNSDNQLAIAEFKGKNAIVEYFEPFNPDFPGELVIGAVSQAYRDIQSILLTFIGINCPQGADWQLVKHCVCRITFHDNIYMYYCSGSLVNNVRSDGTPYFLSANHCLSTNTLASTLIAYFNYESDSCNGTFTSSIQTMSGSSLISTNSYSDFTLLKLNQMPPPSYLPYYSGWDASGRISANGTCIHHPGGTLKSIALDYNPPTSYPGSLQWTDNSNVVISTSAPNTHWEVVFNVGDVEEGSSGSPLFDDNKRIMGQLHGGTDPQEFFGKFSLSWNFNSSNNQQLAYWLDPDKTGTLAIDGFDSKYKPLPDFTANLTTVCINAPVRFTDLSKYAPNQWNWSFEPSTVEFIDGTDSSSVSPEVIFLTGGNYSVTLTATNINGSNSLTKTNYITAGSAIEVKLSGLTNDTTLCGFAFNNIPLKESGAINYTFFIKDSDKINYKLNTDNIFLSLDTDALKLGSFETYVKLTGSHGSCTASDSIKLNVLIPVNDNIANAIHLNYGENGPFSNQCASVEVNEPHPDIKGCLDPKSWCIDSSGTILHNTIWFTFTGPPNGIVVISTKGFDTRIAVYGAANYQDILSGNNSLYNILDANDDRSESDVTSLINNLSVEPGKTYWLQLDGNNGDTGKCYIDFYSNNVEAFPNPNKGNFTVLISYPKETNAVISLYSVLGQALLVKKVFVTNTSNQYPLNLSNVAPGVYFIGVQIDNSELRKKVLIVR